MEKLTIVLKLLENIFWELFLNLLKIIAYEFFVALIE